MVKMTRFTTAYQDERAQKFLVSYVYRPFKFILGKMWSVLPKPTKGNIRFPNSETLLELRDWFLSHETNPDYIKIWEAAFNFGIMKQDDDYYYKIRLEKILKKWLELYEAGKWTWTPTPKPIAWWKND